MYSINSLHGTSELPVVTDIDTMCDAWVRAYRLARNIARLKWTNLNESGEAVLYIYKNSRYIGVMSVFDSGNIWFCRNRNSKIIRRGSI